MNWVFRVKHIDNTDVKLNPESERLEVMVQANSLEEATAKVGDFLLMHPDLNEVYTLTHLGEGNQIQKDLAAFEL